MHLREQVAQYPFWYHHIELPDGVVTPGEHPLFEQRYNLPADLTGMRVLDVGAWDGYWTFECLKRGAKYVLAIDDFSDKLGLLEGRSGWEQFDLCCQSLGFGAEGHGPCERREMSLYDVTEANCGRFDLILFLGTIYHCKYPQLALDTLSAVCDGTMIVESAVCDHFSTYKPGGRQGDRAIEFMPTDEYGGNPSNWFVPTLAALGDMVEAAGFKNVEPYMLTDLPRGLPECRGFVHACKKRKHPKIGMVMSVPRLGFMDNMFCAVEAFASQGYPVRFFHGAFWEQHLTEAFEVSIAEDFDIIFVTDYDTVYTVDDVAAMIKIMGGHPEIDALAGAQIKRESANIMFGVLDEHGAKAGSVSAAHFQGELTRISAAHFGLTAIRISKLKELPLPWLWGQPGPDNRWDEGRVDADMYFWDKWGEHGFTLYQANHIRLGHLELMSTWPAGPDFRAVSQHIGSYTKNGKPHEVQP